MNKLSIDAALALALASLCTSTYTATPSSNAEALRKAQVKRDRKAANRFGK